MLNLMPSSRHSLILSDKSAIINHIDNDSSYDRNSITTHVL